MFCQIGVQFKFKFKGIGKDKLNALFNESHRSTPSKFEKNIIFSNILCLKKKKKTKIKN